MKKFAGIALVVLLCGCYAERPLQVDMLGAELVKIDTIYRYTGREQALVWKCSNKVEYISYEPIHRRYRVGTRMVVMVRR